MTDANPLLLVALYILGTLTFSLAVLKMATKQAREARELERDESLYPGRPRDDRKPYERAA